MKKLFTILSVIVLFSCANDHENKRAKTHFDFDDKKADSLYQVVLNNQYSDIKVMQEAAEQLRQLKNDKANLVGEYYAHLSDYNRNGSMDGLQEYYDKIKNKDDFEYLKLQIDFEYIINRYDSYDYKKAANRINNTLEYIHKKEYALERFVLVNGASANSTVQEFKEKEKDIKSFIDGLAKDEWSLYHSKLYRVYAKVLRRNDRKEEAFEIYDYLLKKNKEYNLLTENVHCLFEYSRFLYDDKTDTNNKEKYLEEAIALALKSNYTNYLPLFHRNYGHYFFEEEKYESAYEQYSKAVAMDSILDYNWGYSTDNIYRGWAHFKINPTKNYDGSLKYYRLALEMSPNKPDIKKLAYQRQMWSLSALNRKKEAQQLEGKINSLNEQIKASSTDDKIIDYRNRLQLRFSDMNSRINQLSAQNELKDTELRMQKVVLLLSFVLVIFFSYLFYSLRKRLVLMKNIEEQNVIIEQKNNDLKNTLALLEKKQVRLNKQNQRLSLILNRREQIILRLQKFAAVLAHDFKQPVITIVSSGRFLNKTVPVKLNEKENQFFSHIVDSTERLSRMVDTLYRYSNNTLALLNKFELIDLNSVIEDVEKDLAITIKNKKAKISVMSFPYLIKGDRILIYQLFQNLISNALKYSKENVPPRIVIKGTLSESKYLITVSDNGIGIEENLDLDIFSLSTRVKETSNKEGHGLGLATSKEIIEIHEGEISYDSYKNKGTTFNLYFTNFERKSA